MSTRISSATLLTLLLAPLGACGQAKTENNPQTTPETARPKPAVELIECAHARAALARDCLVDRQSGGDGLILTVRHPDGAFRRLATTNDGRGVISADGAEQAVVSVVGDGQIDVALGGDLYRLPATIGAGPPKRKTP